MSRLSVMDALGAGQLEYPDRPKKQRSYGINGLLEDIDTQLLARNERRLAERTESLRESPVAAGNELGAVATGLSSAAMGLAAPVIRTFSSEIADDAQMQSAALQAAQQQNVQEEDYGAVRGFVNRNLPGAVNSVSQAAGLAAAGGMPGLMAGFGAGTFDRSFYEGRQNLLDVPDAAGFGVRDAVLETAPMAVFQGLSKFVPAAAGLEGLFLKPMNQKGVRDIVKTAIIGMGSELTEESITAVGQALNRASSIPGAEDAANWTGEDGTFASSPMAEQLKQVAEQTAITMGLGKVIQQLNPAERAQTIEFVDRQSRRGFEKMSSLVKEPLRKVFKGDRKKAAEVLAPLVTDQERADFGGLPTEAQVVGDEPVTEVPQGVADEEAVPQPGQAATAAPPQEAVDPTVDPVVTQVPGEATTEVLTPTGDVEETGLEPESATDITGRRNEVVEATVAEAQRAADDFNQPVAVVETPDNQIVVVPADSVPDGVTVIQAVTPREPTQPTLDPQAPSLAPAEATSSPAPAPVLEPQSESVDDSGFIDDQVEQDLEARPSAEPVMGMAPMSIEEMQEQKNNLLLTAEENEGGELDDDARSRIEMLDQMIWDAEQAQQEEEPAPPQQPAETGSMPGGQPETEVTQPQVAEGQEPDRADATAVNQFVEFKDTSGRRYRGYVTGTTEDGKVKIRLPDSPVKNRTVKPEMLSVPQSLVGKQFSGMDQTRSPDLEQREDSKASRDLVKNGAFALQDEVEFPDPNTGELQTGTVEQIDPIRGKLKVVIQQSGKDQKPRLESVPAIRVIERRPVVDQEADVAESQADVESDDDWKPSGTVYASGLTRSPADIQNHIDKGEPVGVSMLRGLSQPVRKTLTDYAADGGKVFLDSGAFTAFVKGKEVDWDNVLFTYKEMVSTVPEESRSNVTIVAPDIVGNPEETYELQGELSSQFQELVDMGASFIVPVQKNGKNNIQGEFAALTNWYTPEANEKAVIGVPFNAKAWAQEDVLDYLRAKTKGQASQSIHLLGGGPSKVRALMDAAEKEGLDTSGVGGDALSQAISKRKRKKKTVTETEQASPADTTTSGFVKRENPPQVAQTIQQKKTSVDGKRAVSLLIPGLEEYQLAWVLPHGNKAEGTKNYGYLVEETSGRVLDQARYADEPMQSVIDRVAPKVKRNKADFESRLQETTTTAETTQEAVAPQADLSDEDAQRQAIREALKVERAKAKKESEPSPSLPETKYEVYPYGDKFAIRGENERGVGDEIYDTQELAEQAAKENRERDSANQAYQDMVAEKVAKEEAVEAQKKAEYEDIDGFADDKPAMKRGAARKVLNKEKRYSDGAMKSKDMIRDKIAKGWYVEEVDGKDYLSDPKNDVQRRLNKTEADYAQYLQDRPAKPAEQSAPQEQPATQQAKPKSAQRIKDDAKVAAADKKVADAFKKFGTITRAENVNANAPINPKVISATVELTTALAEAGIVRFERFINTVKENMSEGWVRRNHIYLEEGWSLASEDDPRLDKAGNALEILGEDNGDTTTSQEKKPAEEGLDDEGREGEGTSNKTDMDEGSPKSVSPTKGKGKSKRGDRSTGKAGVQPVAGASESGDAAKPGGTGSGQGVRVDSRRKGRADFRIEDKDEIGVKFQKKKRFKKNLEAIETLKQIEEENREATLEEQEKLIQYVGWGGLKEAFSTREDQWADEGKQVKDLLTQEEYNSAERSLRNAHYTSPEVISAMWDGLTESGFKGGRILEPSVGIGHFFGMMPDSMMDSSEFDAVERDSISARISRLLYPSSSVTHAPYQDVPVPDEYYDLIISNVPFGQGTVNDSFDPDLKKLKQPVHNFFFLKSLKKLREGGVAAFITSRYTMDGKSNIREKIEEMGGRFVGAVRLPNNAFKGIADTGVTTDIIFIQKDSSASEPWQKTEKQGPFEYNEYYHTNPENLLGYHAEGAGTQPGEMGLMPSIGNDLGSEVRSAISNMPIDKESFGESSVGKEIEDTEFFKQERVDYKGDLKKLDVKPGWTVVKDDKLYRREGDFLVSQPIPYKTKTNLARIKKLDRLRRVRRELMELERNPDASDSDIEASRTKLNEVYDAYVKKNGYLNTVYNRTVFKADDDVFLLAGLENWDSVKKVGTKIDVFKKRVDAPYSEPTTSETPRDAVMVSLANRGKIDKQYMSELLGVPEDELAELVTEVAFVDPDTGDLVHIDDYLSGNIAEKIAAAEKAAEKDAGFSRNVDELKKILPEPKTPDKIKARLRSPYIADRHYEQFISHITDIDPDYITVKQLDVSGRYGVSVQGPRTSAEDSEYGTSRRPARDLIERVLNNKAYTVYRPQDQGGGVDKAQTAAARAMADKIQREFEAWVYKDPKRAADIADNFNKNFNVWVEAKSDGSHLVDPKTGVLPGANQNIKLRPHQLAAVWRSISQGNTLLAHEVGLGKTFIMASTVMEKKRLGLAKKQMIVVPNHLIEQFPREFKQLYPNAKILAPTSDQFNPANRRVLLERVRNGDWDAVIIPMSSFKRVPMSEQAVRAKFSTQLGELEKAIKAAKAAKGTDNKNYVSELAAAKDKLESMLGKMLNKDEKDEGPYFDEIGIDGLTVDEAHEFKNLWFMTSMGRVPGVNNTGNQTTFDMWIKTDYLNKKTDEKGIQFATGTPISNSVSEMYTMQRYLQPTVLDQMGLKSFDAWANTFGSVVNDIEVTPTGDGFREHSRFKRFTNVKQLSDIFRQVADVKFAADVGLDKGRPEIKGGKPIIIQAQPSISLLDEVRTLSDRMDSIRAGNREDNALSVTTAGRKAATDMRLLDGEEIAWSKINLAVEQVANIHTETAEDKGAQIIWLDMGVPKKDKPKKSADEGLDSDTDEEGPTGADAYNLYQDIKDKLIEKGIDPDEVAFIHDADSNAKRQAMFRAVNDGEVRVILANTARMGTGANVQERIAAVHHLDAPWKPSDITQRDGRAIRQGNIYQGLGGVQIYRYVTQGSFDAYIWQLLENKDGMIRQIMLGEIDDAEDVGAVELDADEVKAMASANPKVMELVRLESSVQKLSTEYNGFLENKNVASWRLRDEQARLENLKIRQENHNAVLKSMPSQDDIEFEVKVDDKTYTTMKKAGEAVLEKALADQAPRENEIMATIAGIEFHWKSIESKDSRRTSLQLKHNGKHIDQLDMSEDARGLASRMWNKINSLYELPETDKYFINRSEEEIKKQKKIAEAKWEYEAELDKKSGQLNRLRAEVGTSALETRAITPLTKQALMARFLSERLGRPVTMEQSSRKWVFADGKPISPPLVNKTKKKVDDEVNKRLKKMFAGKTLKDVQDRGKQTVTADLFFDPRNNMPKGPLREGSPEDFKGRQPPRESILARKESGSETRPEGRRGSAKTSKEESAEETGPISHTSITSRVAKIWDATFRAGRVVKGADGQYKQSKTNQRSGQLIHSSPHVIRMVKDSIGDLGLQAHELAHHIDETTDMLDKVTEAKLKKELYDNDYQQNPRRKNKKEALKEGFAEVLRYWLSAPETGPLSFAAKAPLMSDYMDDYMDANPKTAKKLEKTRELYRRYYDQTPQQRAASQVRESDEPERMADETRAEFIAAVTEDASKTFQINWFDQYTVLRDMQELAIANGWKNKDDKGNVIKNGAYDLRMAHLHAAPQHVQQAVRNGIHSVEGKSELLSKTSLLKAREAAEIKDQQDYTDAVSWIYATFTMDMHKTDPDYNSGLMVEDAEAILAETSAEDAKRYAILHDGMTDASNALLALEVQAGLITQKDADRMIKKYPRYIPLMRVYEQSRQKGLGSNAIDIHSTVRKRSKKGSDAPILDPTIAIINRMNQVYTKVFDQQVLHRMADHADSTNGLGGLMEKVKPNTVTTKTSATDLLNDKLVRDKLESMGVDVDSFMADPDLQKYMIRTYRPDMRGSKGELIVPIRRFNKKSGKIETDLYRLDERLYEAIQKTPDVLRNPVSEFFGKMTRTIRSGGVGLNPAFGMGAIFIDWKAFQERSRYTSGWETVFSPITSMFDYIGNQTGLKKSEMIQLYKEMGGLLATQYGKGADQAVDIRDQMLKLTPVEKKKHWIRDAKRKAVRFGHATEAWIAVSDVGPRIAEFAGVLKSHGYELKDGKIFNTKTKKFERPDQEILVEAINAASEATVNFKRRGRTAATVNQFIPFFTASMASMNKQYRIAKNAFGKNPSEANRKRVLWANGGIALLTAMMWAMRHDDDDYEEQPDWLKYGYWTITWGGKPLWRVPRGYEESVVPNLVEGMLNSMDPESQDGIKEAMWQTMTKLIPPHEVAGATGVIEAWGNYDTFRQSSIENMAMQGLPKAERSKRWTTEFAKWLSPVLGSKVSPAQIDHVIEKGTGGLGTKAIRALEGTATALSGGGTDKLKRASEELSLFRRFNVSKDYSESLDEVYDRAETLTQQLNSQKKAGKERNPDMMAEKSRLNRVKDLNSSLRDLMEGMSDRDQRFSVEKYIIGLSRWGLGKKDLDRYTNPLGLKGLPDNVRAVISEALTKTIIRSIVETDSEDEGYLQSIESARVFLKQTGITKAQAGALLTKYYRGEPLSRDRYSRKQQIKKRAAKRRTLARLMQ